MEKQKDPIRHGRSFGQCRAQKCSYLVGKWCVRARACLIEERARTKRINDKVMSPSR